MLGLEHRRIGEDFYAVGEFQKAVLPGAATTHRYCDLGTFFRLLARLALLQDQRTGWPRSGWWDLSEQLTISSGCWHQSNSARGRYCALLAIASANGFSSAVGP